MSEGMTLDELKQVNIDYYVNLMRIKKAQNGTNDELDKVNPFVKTLFKKN